MHNVLAVALSYHIVQLCTTHSSRIKGNSGAQCMDQRRASFGQLWRSCCWIWPDDEIKVRARRRMCGWFNLAQELNCTYATCRAANQRAADQLPAAASCMHTIQTLLVDTRCTRFLAEKGADVHSWSYLHVGKKNVRTVYLHRWDWGRPFELHVV